VGIRKIAVCAGSGSGVFKALSEKVDVIVTGELSHHEVLSYVASGTSVILCGHTNTERGYLHTLQRKLADHIAQEYGESRVEVIVSKADKDPVDLFNPRD
jgi:putative NIF3 family GTP cyclohydrolase 1 type 2